jgi:membrane associated rhomboid family serine protease
MAHAAHTRRVAERWHALLEYVLLVAKRGMRSALLCCHVLNSLASMLWFGAAVNALSLWFMGQPILQMLGRTGFLGFYLGSALFGVTHSTTRFALAPAVWSLSYSRLLLT